MFHVRAISCELPDAEIASRYAVGEEVPPMTNRPKEWLHSFWYTDQFNTVIRTSITVDSPDLTRARISHVGNHRRCLRRISAFYARGVFSRRRRYIPTSHDKYPALP